MTEPSSTNVKAACGAATINLANARDLSAPTVYTRLAAARRAPDAGCGRAAMVP